MKTLTALLLASLTALVLIPVGVLADGGFVTVYVPKWNKYKDINEPTQKAIIVYDKDREDLILQVKYEGPVRQFGWLIPVPNLPTVQNGSMKCFYELSQYTQQRFEPVVLASATDSMDHSAAPPQPPPVKVIETKTVGAYQIAVLSANRGDALKKWLRDNNFYLPRDKFGIVDSYVKKQWYFVAVKINLEQSLFGFLSTSSKLASGELNPLQISFASDRCVFPLKISSINGKPSEVQVYVLSPEPLVEKRMLEEKLPLIYSNEVARAEARKDRRIYANWILFAGPEDLLPYLKVNGADLPDCSKLIPRLAGKSWWLTKQTWTFKPKEMRDLEFEPALPVFADLLGTRYGRFAAASLTPFGMDAVPTIIAAMQSPNPSVRLTAADNFVGGSWGYSSIGFQAIDDPRFADAAFTWLKDPEPTVRRDAIQFLAASPTHYEDPKYAAAIVEMLRDEDADVRQAAVASLLQDPEEAQKFVSVFQQMLVSKNPGAQASAIQMFQGLQFKVSKEELLSLLKSSDVETLDGAWIQLHEQGGKLSDDESRTLLENPAPVARLMGLDVLAGNSGRQSIEMALPFLRDRDEFVRLKASETLQLLTGQHFTEDQADEWTRWWDENKTRFAAEGTQDQQTP